MATPSVSMDSMEIKIKSLVSKNKNRHIEGRFNLDLTYITPRIIAMGYPANHLEAMYRNDANDVVSFLRERHGERFFLFNLCCERSYDPALFRYRVDTFPLQDHNPPPLGMVPRFCRRVHELLARHPDNVVAVHCKAGKGRTGVMISCYLLHAGLAAGPQSAIDLYGRQRTRDGRGITIPSQKRYVRYYHRLLREQRDGRQYRPAPLRLLRLCLRSSRSWDGLLQLDVLQRAGPDGCSDCSGGCGSGCERRLAALEPVRVRRGDAEVTLPLDGCQTAAGDVKLELWSKSYLRPRELLCRVWFNTWFVAELAGAATATATGAVNWGKADLDLACNDRRVPDDARIRLEFRRAEPPPPPSLGRA